MVNRTHLYLDWNLLHLWLVKWWKQSRQLIRAAKCGICTIVSVETVIVLPHQCYHSTIQNNQNSWPASACLSWPATLRQAVRGRDPSSQQSDSNVVSWLCLHVTHQLVFTTSSTSSIVITSDRFKYRSLLITSNTHFHMAGWITVLWHILLLLDNVIHCYTIAEFQHCFMIRRGTFKPLEQIFSFSDNKDLLCFRPQHSNRFCN